MKIEAREPDAGDHHFEGRIISACAQGSPRTLVQRDTESVEFNEIYRLPVMVVDQQADDPHRSSRHDLQDRGGKVRRGHRRDRRVQRERPAGAGRHGVDREIRARCRETFRGHERPARQASHAFWTAKNHEREAEIVAQAGRFAGGVHDFTPTWCDAAHRHRAGRKSGVHGGGFRYSGTRYPDGSELQAALEKYAQQQGAMRGRARARC